VKKEHQFVSYCAKYCCALCAYHRGTIVNAAQSLLELVERYGSLRLIAGSSNACSFDEFLRGLRWLASQRTPCEGCRFGGGWSWWPDCPVRECCTQKGVDFCYQCEDFPCQALGTEPLLERKQAIIDANNQIKTLGIEEYSRRLKARYEQ
jgi:hypothetical protein